MPSSPLPADCDHRRVLSRCPLWRPMVPSPWRPREVEVPVASRPDGRVDFSVSAPQPTGERHSERTFVVPIGRVTQPCSINLTNHRLAYDSLWHLHIWRFWEFLFVQMGAGLGSTFRPRVYQDYPGHVTLHTPIRSLEFVDQILHSLSVVSGYLLILESASFGGWAFGEIPRFEMRCEMWNAMKCVWRCRNICYLQAGVSRWDGEINSGAARNNEALSGHVGEADPRRHCREDQR